jgi:3-deoxy-manno-octulosonate cytidylyltransferase (CMP-KDO synthetase)|tara:strand:+ start:81 stop:824 length:744 start_codon:yes stop_codon:yes gene_type:complete
MKIIGLIPTRMGSTRLPAKPLLEINNIPLIIHTYKRAIMSKKLDDVIICCDDVKILEVAKKFNAKAIITSKKHKNGTERILEGYIKQKKQYDLVIDIQGDEPLLNPKHIDEVINFHKKNFKTDIILPTLNIKNAENTNIVKVITDIKDNVIFLSRTKLPTEFKKKNNSYKKHLSIISFKPEALKKFSKSKKTPLESSEDIELLRAIEIGLKIKTVNLKGDSFSIDVLEDFKKAINQFKKDQIIKYYK